MPLFSKQSAARLATAHPDLQRLFNEVVKHWDCQVTEGHRGKEAQDAAVRAKKSQTPWPTSKHNKVPAMAVDVYPYPINFSDYERAYAFAGFVLGVSKMLGINVRWGGDWDNDRDLHDSRFLDLSHFELL